MKRITAIALLAIANLALAGTSFAQSNGVQAKVPFDFTVGDKVFPAGTYTIRGESSHVIVITNQNHPEVSAVSLVDQANYTAPKDGNLLFQRYGSQYFLSEILCNAADMNLQMKPSQREKRVQLQQAKINVGSAVLVAAR